MLIREVAMLESEMRVGEVSLTVGAELLTSGGVSAEVFT